jgi:hypothetical protein
VSAGSLSVTELAELRATAADRFYRWALDACAKEVGDNFVHVKTIRGSWVLGILEFIERWSPSDQLSVMQAKLASGRPDAQLSERQRQLLHAVGQALSAGCGPRYMKLLNDYAAGSYRVSKPLMRRALKRDLIAALGRPERTDGSEWRHRTELGKWTVVTAVDTGGSGRQFEIGHTVSSGGSGLFWTSPAHWWGLGMQTVWDRVALADVDGATGAAAALCRYFIEQVPQMLDGL